MKSSLVILIFSGLYSDVLSVSNLNSVPVAPVLYMSKMSFIILCLVSKIQDYTLFYKHLDFLAQSGFVA